MPPYLRKTRFVCVSDTHNASPANGAFKLPKGDVLIHAGDLTNQGSLSELRKTLDWIEQAEFEIKIVIAGNHDITLDSSFYVEHGSYFHNQIPQDPQACMEAVKACKSITFLNHDSAELRLSKKGGSHTTFKAFGSPYSPAKGFWAFGYHPEQASNLWDKIPLDTHVVITHTPPKYHCDKSKDRGAAGCETLRQTLWRVRPYLAICGHVHEGRGAERVLWDLESSDIKYKESEILYWIDPGLDNKKQCLIDLTGKAGEPIDNTDSSTLDTLIAESSSSPSGSDIRPSLRWKRSPHASFSAVSKYDASAATSSKGDSPLTIKPSTSQHVNAPANTLSTLTSDPHDVSSAVHGQGGIPPSGRCDMEALSGRLARRETCVINAAIMASSWPHTTKRYNKPIVVDIDLPTWEE